MSEKIPLVNPSTILALGSDNITVVTVVSPDSNRGSQHHNTLASIEFNWLHELGSPCPGLAKFGFK
jgi:hypothetical protein